MESITPCVYGDGLYTGTLNNSTSFFINTPKYIEGNLNIEIKDPENFHVKTSIIKLTENIYEIKYLPNKVGLFHIIINYNGVPIRNSPFNVRVTSLDGIKVLGEFENFFKAFTNPKIFNFDVNVEKCICFDTKEAGPGNLLSYEKIEFLILFSIFHFNKGNLKLQIVSPNNENLFCKKVTSSQQSIERFYFTPTEEGQYSFNFSYNNTNFLDKPVLAQTKNFSYINEIKIYGTGICSVELNKDAEFFVDCSRLKDLDQYPEITFMDFMNDMKNNLKNKVTRLENNIFKCNYFPQIPGKISGLKLNNLFENITLILF